MLLSFFIVSYCFSFFFSFFEHLMEHKSNFVNSFFKVSLFVKKKSHFKFGVGLFYV